MTNDDAPAAEESSSPWSIDQVVPSTFLVAWSAESPPSFFEVKAILDQTLEEPVVADDEIEADDPDIKWSLVVRFGSRPLRAIIWVEPIVNENLLDEFRSAKWFIGIETPLDSEDPITDYTQIMRMLARAFPDAPFIIDARVDAAMHREDLDRLFVLTDHEPPATLLWTIHAVHPTPDASDAASTDGEARLWLHTHGLQRCGLPDLEMLEVPTNLVDAGVRLMNTLGELMFEADLPQPGEEFSVGVDIDIAVQPLEEITKYMADDAPGSAADRRQTDGEGQGEGDHGGVRAVIVASKPIGRYKRIWQFPRAALERLAEDDAILFRTSRATHRQASIARATWPDLAMAFASLTGAGKVGDAENQVMFLAKAPVGNVAAEPHEQNARTDDDSVSADPDTDEPRNEHLWFEVRRIAGDRAEVAAVNTSVMSDAVRAGDVGWLRRDQISDWAMITPDEGLLGPDDVPFLPGIVESLRAEPPS